jgi:ribosome-binding factor A
MRADKPSKRQMRRLAAQLGPEDGLDPKDLARQYREPKGGGRKTSQLCRQVAVTVEEVLAEQSDEVIRDLTVVDVAPAPDESRLLVTVAPGPAARPADPMTVLAHLDEAARRIRAEVAGAITRRRTPALEFRFALPGATG